MNTRIIGIAGGSGTGKSTVAISLCRAHVEDCAVVHLDDYFKKSEDAVHEGGVINWEHPDSLRLYDLYHDLCTLKEGKPITVLTKSELYHTAYDYALKNKIEYVIEPRSVILVEGYLALHDPRIRDLMDLKIYLDMSVEESSKRRSANKFAIDKEYFENILQPMHEKFVVPTKAYANFVVDVSGKSSEEVFKILETKIFN